jgi:hypothetical protein
MAGTSYRKCGIGMNRLKSRKGEPPDRRCPVLLFLTGEGKC